jgi:hypothetical protein
MKKYNNITVIILLAFMSPVLNSAFAQELTNYRCDLILGDWRGVYEDKGTSWLVGSYQFDGAYDEDGSVIIDFEFLDLEETDRHEGHWLCENGILTTGLATRWGGSVLYHYQIIDINQNDWTYRLISPEAGAPTFFATRVGARLMTPEIFDTLENPQKSPLLRAF